MSRLERRFESSDLHLQKELFVNHLREIEFELDGRGISRVVVGGAAVRATLGLPIQFRRDNETIPDIDMLGMGPDYNTIIDAVDYFRQIAKKDPIFPEVGLEPATFAATTQIGFFSMHSGLRLHEGRAYLTYQKIEQEIPMDVLRVIQRNYGGVTIGTFRGETTLWRYFLRGGIAKPQDMEKIIELGHMVGKNPEEQLSQDAREAHQTFLKRVQDKYGLRLRFYDSFWRVDSFLNGGFSGMRGGVYDKWTKFFSG